MRFNEHFHLRDKHAFLSPSSWHWLNYDEQRLEARFHTKRAAQLGTELHEFARRAIDLGIKLPKTRTTLNMYVNDGINYKMATEVCLFYSENCFGHADTISFRRNKLRISDLKTGITVASFQQLKVYAALFCLEYGLSPYDIQIELRIYQHDDIKVDEPVPDDIADIMDTIIKFNMRIEEFKTEFEEVSL